MKKLLEKFTEKLVRKTFGLLPSQAKQIETEAKKNWGKNESALMRHIVSSWFKK